MFYFSKPAGGLYVGKALVKPPFVHLVSAGLPVRGLFVSDIHIRKNTWPVAEHVISAIKTLNAELVLLGGDYAEYDEGLTRFFEALSHVKPKYGIYAVEGNNDYPRFHEDHERVKREIEKSGARLLRDECAFIQTDKGAIEILGARCAYFEETHPEGLFSEKDGVFRILIAHEPLKSTLKAVNGKADLMLSGHTHGGQVNVLGFTCYELLQYEGSCRYTHLAGLKKVGKTSVLVSRGIGTSKFAVRFGARPEIHLIT
ncbi:MAG: metallophosphoesterase family protein [Clostridia bacterium]|nr:metallophosphoesterase family protein [Clostridia bacterium]